MPSELVYLWADYANALITPAGELFHISAPYDDFSDMTGAELEQFARSELQEIAKRLRG